MCSRSNKDIRQTWKIGGRRTLNAGTVVLGVDLSLVADLTVSGTGHHRWSLACRRDLASTRTGWQLQDFWHARRASGSSANTRGLERALRKGNRAVLKSNATAYVLANHSHYSARFENHVCKQIAGKFTEAESGGIHDPAEPSAELSRTLEHLAILTKS